MVKMVIPGRSEVHIELPDRSKVNVCPELMRELRALLGRNAVDTSCKPATIAPKNNGKKQYLKRVK
jgi:hypothetical protein